MGGCACGTSPGAKAKPSVSRAVGFTSFLSSNLGFFIRRDRRVYIFFYRDDSFRRYSWASGGAGRHTRQSAWWLRFQMLYFFKTFGFPSGEFLYFLPLSAHSASCQYYFLFPGKGLLRSREARSTWLCAAPPLRHLQENPTKYPPPPHGSSFLKRNL